MAMRLRMPQPALQGRDVLADRGLGQAGLPGHPLDELLAVLALPHGAGGHRPDVWHLVLVDHRAEGAKRLQGAVARGPPDLAGEEEEIASILALHEPPIPAVWCRHPVETADYPVPADLREQ